MFDGIAWHILFFLLGLGLLVAAGSFLVKSLSKIAVFLRISEYVIGFVILAFATSVPELFVGIASAIEKAPSLALGTVIGSNIANLTLMIGIPVLLVKGIKVQSEKTKSDALYLVALSALPLALMLIGNEISRIDGIILVLAFFIYIRKLYVERRAFKKEIVEKIRRWEIVLAVIVFIISLFVLFGSAELVVWSAEALAIDFILPPIVIGLFLIALGTSLPELVVGSSAALKGHTEISLGNIIGSGIANATLILGVVSLIYPITSNFVLFATSGVYMLITTFIFATFIRSGNKLEWAEGISLMLLYGFFIILEFFIKGVI